MGKIPSRLFGTAKSNPSSKSYTPYGTDGLPLPYLDSGNGREYFGQEGPTPPPEVSPERERLDGLRGRQNVQDVIFNQALPAAPGGTDRVRGNFDDWPGSGMGAFSDQRRLERLRTPTPPARSIPSPTHGERVVVPLPVDEQAQLNRLRMQPVPTDNGPPVETLRLPPPIPPPPAPMGVPTGESDWPDRPRGYVVAPNSQGFVPRGEQPVDSAPEPVLNDTQQTEPRRRRRRQGPPSTRR